MHPTYNIEVVGYGRFTKGETTQAEAKCLPAIALLPQHVPFYLLLAPLYAAQNHRQDAEATTSCVCTRLSRASPQQQGHAAAGWRAWGWSLVVQGRQQDRRTQAVEKAV